MVAGAADVVGQVLKVKSQMDSGMFRPMQLAAVEALRQGPEWFEALNAEYRARRELAGYIFDLIGARYDRNSGGMFLWGRIDPDNRLACGDTVRDGAVTLGEKVSDALLYGADVFITPGFIFGRNGADYVRISLCADRDTLKKAYVRISELNDLEHRSR